VLHDRHLVDALVDPDRYRYAGPRWLLRLIWRLIPKPDLIVLLDAPAEVLQARKQEVAFEVTARQRDAYRALLGELGGGRVVDVSGPMEQVASDVDNIILKLLGERVRRRLHLGGRQ
jgi:thymidylate kinase